jgi:choline-sulfatase
MNTIRAMGVAGHPFAVTPNSIARGAARVSTRSTATCRSAPSRASFAGRYAHELHLGQRHRHDGSIEGWGHALQSSGHRVDAIGKLHYRNAEAPTGFDRP